MCCLLLSKLVFLFYLNQFNSLGRPTLTQQRSSEEKLYTHHWQVGTMANFIVATIGARPCRWIKPQYTFKGGVYFTPRNNPMKQVLSVGTIYKWGNHCWENEVIPKVTQLAGCSHIWIQIFLSPKPCSEILFPCVSTHKNHPEVLLKLQTYPHRDPILTQKVWNRAQHSAYPKCPLPRWC